MDYRIHRKFLRKMFNINLVLSILYLTSLIAVFAILNRSYNERYFIETNSGFMIPVQSFSPGQQEPRVAQQFFE